jgi:hypothetical protein
MVIGTYFGAQGRMTLCRIVFTFLTLAYSLKGGMSSSILQMLFRWYCFRF